MIHFILITCLYGMFGFNLSLGSICAHLLILHFMLTLLYMSVSFTKKETFRKTYPKCSRVVDVVTMFSIVGIGI